MVRRHRFGTTDELPWTQRARAFLALCLLLSIFEFLLGLGLPMRASASPPAEFSSPSFHVRRVVVTRHKSRTFEFEAPFASAVIGAPDIADVLPMSDRVIYLQGKKIGTTNVSIFDQSKQLIGVIDVEVTVDSDYIGRKIRESIGGSALRVSSNNEQIVLSGRVRNAVEAERAVALAQGLAPENTVVNMLQVASAQQVLLKVRFIEASREAGRNLGVNWFVGTQGGTRGINTGLGGPTQVGQSPNPTPGGLPLFQTIGTFAGATTAAPFGVAIANLANGGTSIDVIITALETRGIARRLAEPDLVALSGDKASFLAGGEIPVPVVQPSSGTTPAITVDYKPFGVTLEFVPTVLADGIINLKLFPSVSQLDYTNAIRAQGFLIPALTKREARTTIELRDGQSFAIAGLLQSEGLRNISEIPWLGSIPVLGALLRSASYQQNETDLVVIVTPHLVSPAVPGQRLATPLDTRQPSNDRDLFLLGRTDVGRKATEPAIARDAIRPYGHIID